MKMCHWAVCHKLNPQVLGQQVPLWECVTVLQEELSQNGSQEVSETWRSWQLLQLHRRGEAGPDLGSRAGVQRRHAYLTSRGCEPVREGPRAVWEGGVRRENETEENRPGPDFHGQQQRQGTEGE